MGDSGEYLYVLGQEAGNSLKGHAEPDALQILDRADDKWDPNLKNSQVELELLVYRENELRKTYHMLLKYRDTNHVLAEMIYWQQLDRIRMRVYEAAVRKYFMAVKKDASADAADFLMQHRVRVTHAEALLPQSPLRDYGIDRLIAEARTSTLPVVAAGALDWLPDIAAHFVGLS